MTRAVPDAFLGVWKRTLLRTPAGDDTTSTVYWLQTPRWHADIRIPSSRPEMMEASGLADLDSAALRALASQQGFAGVTTVEGDICRWHRRVDYQPPSRFTDIGRIAFSSGDRMHEYGVEQDYFEVWERVPGSVGTWAALERNEAGRSVWMFRSGDHAIRVVPRGDALPPADDLVSALSPWDDARARRWLDFEISLARVEPTGEWVVRHSTLPWLEGDRLADGGVLVAVEAGAGTQAGRHWQRLD